MAPFCAAVASFYADGVGAGAWLQEEGHGQVIAAGSFSQSSSYFDQQGNPFRGSDYRKTEFPVLVEYGVADWLTLIGASSYLRTSAGGPVGGDYGGLGYNEFGGRFQLSKGDTSVLSIQALARFPGASDESNPAEIGNTDTEFDLRTLIGHSFKIGAYDAFLDGQLAYRIRTGDPADEFRLDLTFGIRPAPNWLLLAQSFNVVSVGSAYGAFDDTRYHKIQLSAVYDFAPSWSVQLGGVITLAGAGAALERGVIGSLWHRF